MGNCYLCKSEAHPFLVGRPDYEYGIASRLSYERCTCCGLVFAKPMPSPHLIPSFYASYSTHAHAQTSLFAKLARRKTLRETARAIGRNKQLRILDYGCGNGIFINDLCQLGYVNAVGYDFDPEAVKSARVLGIDATNNWEDVVGQFDVITLNHVIEHLPDPAQEIEKLAQLLRPGGLMIMRTPNNASLMSIICGEKWRGWETPRHLNILNNRALKILLDKSSLEIIRCFDSKAMFFGIFHESLKRPLWKTKYGKIMRHVLALVAYPWGAGEESVAVARKAAVAFVVEAT